MTSLSTYGSDLRKLQKWLVQSNQMSASGKRTAQNAQTTVSRQSVYDQHGRKIRVDPGTDTGGYLSARATFDYGNLPLDLQVHVLTFSSSFDLAACCRVCKNFIHIVREAVRTVFALHMHCALPKGLSRREYLTLCDKLRNPSNADIVHELFLWASKMGYIKFVRELLEAPLMEDGTVLFQTKRLQPLHIDRKRLSDGCASLHVTAQAGCLDIFELLLQHGTDWRLLNKVGKSALFLSSEHGHSDIVHTLLEHADRFGREEVVSAVNQVVVGKETLSPVTVAARNNHPEVLRTLMQYGADLNQVTELGESPLFLACKNGHADVASLIINNRLGLDSIDTASEAGKTPLFVATELGHETVVTLLLQFGADVHKPTYLNKLPLYVACEGNNAKLVRLFLDHAESTKEDVFKVTNFGTTAMFMADKNGNNEIKSLLAEFCVKQEALAKRRRRPKSSSDQGRSSSAPRVRQQRPATSVPLPRAASAVRERPDPDSVIRRQMFEAMEAHEGNMEERRVSVRRDDGVQRRREENRQRHEEVEQRRLQREQDRDTVRRNRQEDRRRRLDREALTDSPYVSTANRSESVPRPRSQTPSNRRVNGWNGSSPSSRNSASTSNASMSNPNVDLITSESTDVTTTVTTVTAVSDVTITKAAMQKEQSEAVQDESAPVPPARTTDMNKSDALVVELKTELKSESLRRKLSRGNSRDQFGKELSTTRTHTPPEEEAKSDDEPIRQPKRSQSVASSRSRSPASSSVRLAQIDSTVGSTRPAAAAKASFAKPPKPVLSEPVSESPPVNADPPSSPTRRKRKNKNKKKSLRTAVTNGQINVEASAEERERDMEFLTGLFPLLKMERLQGALLEHNGDLGACVSSLSSVGPEQSDGSSLVNRVDLDQKHDTNKEELKTSKDLESCWNDLEKKLLAIESTQGPTVTIPVPGSCPAIAKPEAGSKRINKENRSTSIVIKEPLVQMRKKGKMAQLVTDPATSSDSIPKPQGVDSKPPAIQPESVPAELTLAKEVCRTDSQQKEFRPPLQPSQFSADPFVDSTVGDRSFAVLGTRMNALKSKLTAMRDEVLVDETVGPLKMRPLARHRTLPLHTHALSELPPTNHISDQRTRPPQRLVSDCDISTKNAWSSKSPIAITGNSVSKVDSVTVAERPSSLAPKHRSRPSSVPPRPPSHLRGRPVPVPLSSTASSEARRLSPSPSPSPYEPTQQLRLERPARDSSKERTGWGMLRAM